MYQPAFTCLKSTIETCHRRGSGVFVVNSEQISHIVLVFFNRYLAAPQPTLDHSQGDSFTNSMLITACYLFRSEGHREPRSEVGSLSQAERFYCWLGTSICRLGLFKKKISNISF